MIDDRRALEILGTFVTYYNNLNVVNMKYVQFMQNKPPRSNFMQHVLLSMFKQSNAYFPPTN